MYEEAHRMPLDGDLEDKVRGCAGLDCLPHDALVVGVDQRLVQVQHQDLASHKTCDTQFVNVIMTIGLIL